MMLLFAFLTLLAMAAVYALVATIIGERVDDLWLALTGRSLAIQPRAAPAVASRRLSRA